MNYVDVRDAVVESMKVAFKKNNNIEIAAYGGFFTESEIKRISLKTPAILTSLLKIKNEDNTDNSSCNFVTWIVYKANNLDLLADGAVTLVGAVMAFLRQLDIPVLCNIKKIEAENLFSGSLDTLKVTLWAVAWEGELLGIKAVEDENGFTGIFPSLDGLAYFEGYDSHLITSDQVETVKDNINLEVKDGNSNEANT